MTSAQNLWDRIVEKKRRLDAVRPLAVRSLRALDAWYDVELTFTSNAIEGNTLTRSETAIVLEKGLTVRKASTTWQSPPNFPRRFTCP